MDASEADPGSGREREPGPPGVWRRVPGPRELWTAYWPYLGLSFALFVLGGVCGALVVELVDLGTLLGVGDGERTFPEPTVALLVVNNTVVLFLLIASALTLGLGTAAILVYNGVLVGYVSVVVARESGLAAPVVGILPHGVLEVPAVLLASAVAFRFSHQVLATALGRRADVMTRRELREGIAAAVVAFALIPVAAVIEVHVTVTLLERFVR